MDNWLIKSAKAVSNKGGIFTFLRAQLSSLSASFTDNVVAIILVNIFHLHYIYATAIGLICGGITNCVVNYRWTFKAMDVKKRYVAIRYLMVWGGSAILNTSGIFLMTELLKKIPWVMGFSDILFKNVFLVSKIVVSLLVGFIWNYNMHRFFVYKNLNLKSFFERLKNKRLNNKE